ncbi:MAG: 30S ribosomal protein S17, partial [Nanohaloarchaea archaeon QH_8_44_6]
RQRLTENGFQDIEMEGRHAERKEVEEGDKVRIEETKPISKTKSTVITEIIEE